MEPVFGFDSLAEASRPKKQLGQANLGGRVEPVSEFIGWGTTMPYPTTG